jgi:hypothetical protein
VVCWKAHFTPTVARKVAISASARPISKGFPGEGRWTIKVAIDEGVPAYVLSSALYERFSSRGEADFADKLSAMRYQLGGHIEKSPANRRMITERNADATGKAERFDQPRAR